MNEEAVLMGWQLDKNRPIYLQLVERLQSRIVSGEYPPGAKIDSVRDLASEAAVNPNTMQRALAELEQMGLLRTERTSGRFVTEDTALIASVRKDLARQKIDAFVQDMSVLGYGKKDMAALVKEFLEGENKNG